MNLLPIYYRRGRIYYLPARFHYPLCVTQRA